MSTPVRPTGLEFFGAVIASISHEIKNRLAIINEQTLLIKDLAQASVNGRELDPGQLANLADSVNIEIGAADMIIKEMNKFAHSVDDLKKRLDINDILRLTEALYRRIARMRNVKIKIHSPEKPVFVSTIVFLLMNLIWLCLNAVLERIEKTTIHIGCEEASENACVWIKCYSFEDNIEDVVSQEEIIDLANGIKADVKFFPEDNLVRIFLPEDFDWI